jgi:hypothetical protein
MSNSCDRPDPPPRSCSLFATKESRPAPQCWRCSGRLAGPSFDDVAPSQVSDGSPGPLGILTPADALLHERDDGPCLAPLRADGRGEAITTRPSGAVAAHLAGRAWATLRRGEHYVRRRRQGHGPGGHPAPPLAGGPASPMPFVRAPCRRPRHPSFLCRRAASL